LRNNMLSRDRTAKGSARGKSNHVGPELKRSAGARWPGVFLIGSGLLLMLSDLALLWLFRGQLAQRGTRLFSTLWSGAGGLLLLDFTAGFPLGAILVVLGVDGLFLPSRRARRLWLLLLVISLVYFAYHSIAAFRYSSVPFVLFVISGVLFVVLFLALVWVWARKRPGLEPRRRRAADLQLAGGLCFFSAAWQACGLAGAPGFAIYPALAAKLGNQSFLIGQVVALQFFLGLGFLFLLLAMRVDTGQKPE
jgi:hypothetical protein